MQHKRLHKQAQVQTQAQAQVQVQLQAQAQAQTCSTPKFQQLEAEQFTLVGRPCTTISLTSSGLGRLYVFIHEAREGSGGGGHGALAMVKMQKDDRVQTVSNNVFDSLTKRIPLGRLRTVVYAAQADVPARDRIGSAKLNSPAKVLRELKCKMIQRPGRRYLLERLRRDPTKTYVVIKSELSDLRKEECALQLSGLLLMPVVFERGGRGARCLEIRLDWQCPNNTSVVLADCIEVKARLWRKVNP